MKRLVSICAFVIVLLINTVPAHAAGTVAVLSAEDVSLSGNTVLASVSISNNSGVMGFKVTASYSPELLDVSSVTAGNVTAKGNFIHNAGKMKGQVDIIWYANEQTTENGCLFVLTVKPTDNFTKDESTQIFLSFSQADTFNEQYEDVAFDCKSINVSYGEQDQQSTTKPDSDQELSSEVLITDEQIINAVDAALDNTRAGDIDDVDQKTLDEVNDNLRIIAGPNAPQFDSTEELRSQYTVAVRREYLNSLTTTIGKERIQEIISEELTAHNMAKTEDIPDEEKEKFVAAVDEKLHSEDELLKNVSDILSTDDLLDIYKELSENDDENEKESKSNHYPLTIIIISVIAIVVIIAGIILMKKRNKRK